MLSLNAKKTTVLVIDDDPFIREVLSTYLQSRSFEVAVASDGREAIAMLDHGTEPSLAFVDMIMPHKEGIETIVDIKARVPDIKIIAISGGGSFRADDLLRYAEKLGADDSITKPVNFEDLDSKVRKIFRL